MLAALLGLGGFGVNQEVLGANGEDSAARELLCSLQVVAGVQLTKTQVSRGCQNSSFTALLTQCCFLLYFFGGAVSASCFSAPTMTPAVSSSLLVLLSVLIMLVAAAGREYKLSSSRREVVFLIFFHVLVGVSVQKERLL